MAEHNVRGGERQTSDERFVRERAEPAPAELESAGEPDRATDEVTALRAQVAELDDRWRRAAAELDNLRKRLARDTEQQRLQERGRVAAAWLPVVDNLDLALQHADADPAAIVQGVRAVRDQALTVLAGLGFPRRDDLGAKFDPVRHEAVSTTPDTQAEPGTVVAVLRPGYGRDERQLRPAAVIVATQPDRPDTSDGPDRSGGGGVADPAREGEADGRA